MRLCHPIGRARRGASPRSTRLRQRGRTCVPVPAVTRSAVAGPPSTSAVCHTPGGLMTACPIIPKPRINLLLYHGIHGPSARLRSTAVRTATPPSTSEADPGAFDQGSAEPPEAAPEASSRTPTRAAGRVLLEHRVTEERSRRHLVSLIEQRPAVSICRGQRDRSTLLRCGYGRFRFKPPLAFRLRFAPSILVKSSRGPSVWRGGHRMRAHSAVC